MYLFLGTVLPYSQIRAVDHRTRTELRGSRPTTLCQQSQRILRVGRFGLGHSPAEVHQRGRHTPRHASLVTANRRATGRWACLSACRCFSTFANARGKDHQEQLVVYRELPDRRKKGTPTRVRAPVPPKTVSEVLLPFFRALFLVLLGLFLHSNFLLTLSP